MGLPVIHSGKKSVCEDLPSILTEMFPFTVVWTNYLYVPGTICTKWWYILSV